MSKQQAAIERYRHYMTEIRYRIDVINKVLSELNRGGALTGYRESDIEIVFLQFRHCLELIMFASLSAHYSNGYDLSQKIVNKEYNATKLLRFIEIKNPNFYPRPVRPCDIKKIGEIPEVVDLADGFLTKEDFCKLYDQTCGKMLHAQRENKFNKGHGHLIKEAIHYRDQLMRLLDCHWVHLTDELCFRVIMKDSVTGEVGINVMAKVEEARSKGR